MSRHKTGKEKRARRRIAKRAEKREAAAGIEILHQQSQQIGGVTVTMTVGRIHKEKGND